MILKSLGFAITLIFLPTSHSADVERHLGCYYGAWAYTRPGLGEFWPEDIDVSLCDIIYYGFGNILNGTYEMCSWDPWFDLSMEKDAADATIANCIQERDGIAWPPGCVTDDGLEYCHYDGIRRTIALKEKNPNLKVMFSVGGWTAGGWIFSDMAETHANRQKFIKSAVHFLHYFGFDGLDVDWEYPAYDMLPEEPTNPEDKQHFTLLLKELREKLDIEGKLLTFAGTPDPFKGMNAYELEKIVDYVDWINIMSYDYSGPWDPFTGPDAPLYGRWGEGFIGHPKYQFNIHETVQYYLKSGIPGSKLSLGIHTESKGWTLNDSNKTNVYCPADEASPNMTFSRQEGWLNYYEILQFWHNETIEDPRWTDLKPGKENWDIYDKESGNWDGCYLSPYMSQGKYWISYDDEDSVDVKTRYANYYGLRGAFVWEVDTDNFRGLYGKKPYNILSAIRDAIDGNQGLESNEILGYANENADCSPQVPFCDDFDFDDTCDKDSDCNRVDSVLCDDRYSNCFYCDKTEKKCKPGCSDNQNCNQTTSVCNNHLCEPIPSFPAITDITVKTSSCDGCSTSLIEDGLQLYLEGNYGAKCTTVGLDNQDLHDYSSNRIAIFHSGSPDAGLGSCNNYDINVSLNNGTAMWTGEGSWTPKSVDPICIHFYDPQHDKPTCCCNIEQSSISNTDNEVPLTNCHCD